MSKSEQLANTENINNTSVKTTCYISMLFLCAWILPIRAEMIGIPEANPVTTSSVKKWEETRAIPEFTAKNRHQQLDGTVTQPPSQPSLTSFEERFVTGLADFLVDRAKQEARLYLQEEFTEKLCPNTANDQSKIKFKKTCLTITQLNGSNFSMSSATKMLKAAIRDDLRNYPDAYFSWLAEKNDGAVWYQAKIAASIFSELRGSRDISEIIGGLASLDTESICNNNSNCSNQLKNVSKSAKLYWTLSENIRAIRLHKDYPNNREATIAAAVEATLESPDFQRQNKQSLEKIANLIDIVHNLRSQIIDLQNQASQQDTKDANLKLRLRAALTGIDALYQISAVLYPENKLQKLHEATSLAQAIIDDDYARVVLETAILAGSHPDDQSSKFIPLLVELASAESSADMQKIFELAAAPAGSYREKFKSDTLTTITAFGGIAHGSEWYNTSGALENNGFQPFIPIGIQYTKNLSPQNNGKSGVLGGFISIFDLGPLAAGRSNAGTVSNSSNAGFAQVFSPGIYITYNNPYVKAITLGYGVSRTPKLVTAINGEQVDATRRQLFIAIDMTLMAFR